MGQDDYGYDQRGYGVRLTDERAANGARALDGYELDARPDPQWPGLDGSEHVRVRPEEVRSVADFLDRRAEDTRTLPGRLQKATAVSFGPSSWHEANNLKAASEMVSNAVADYIGTTLANLNTAAATLRSVHAHYTGAEQANDENVTSIAAQLDGPGSRTLPQ